VLESEALRVLLDACHETLADARVGDTWLVDMVRRIEDVCAGLQWELAFRRTVLGRKAKGKLPEAAIALD